MSWWDFGNDSAVAVFVRDQIMRRAIARPSPDPVAGLVAESDGAGGVVFVSPQMVGQPGYDSGVWS